MRNLGVSKTRLLLAVSGGPDSSALVCICALLQKKLGCHLFATSIDHGLRPEAANEVAGSKNLCETFGIPCTIQHCDVPAYRERCHLSTETAARALRYACLEYERLRIGADYIVTAHHAGDLAEDVLMRLARGCGWPALGGMRARDDTRHLLRPLLGIEACQLKAILRDLAIPWFTDTTNSDLHYTRNRFRHTIVPMLTQENPNFLMKTRHIAEQAECDRDFFDSLLAGHLNTAPWSLTLTRESVTLTMERAQILKEHKALRLRLYRAAHASLAAVRRDLGLTTNQASWTHFMALEAVILRGEGKKDVQFPGVLVRLERGRIVFRADLTLDAGSSPHTKRGRAQQSDAPSVRTEPEVPAGFRGE